jgi:hypothetical protein
MVSGEHATGWVLSSAVERREYRTDFEYFLYSGLYYKLSDEFFLYQSNVKISLREIPADFFQTLLCKN